MDFCLGTHGGTKRLHYFTVKETLNTNCAFVAIPCPIPRRECVTSSPQECDEPCRYRRHQRQGYRSHPHSTQTQFISISTPRQKGKMRSITMKHWATFAYCIHWAPEPRVPESEKGIKGVSVSGLSIQFDRPYRSTIGVLQESLAHVARLCHLVAADPTASRLHRLGSIQKYPRSTCSTRSTRSIRFGFGSFGSFQVEVSASSVPDAVSVEYKLQSSNP